MKPVVLSKKAAKALGSMPANEAARVLAKIEQLAAAPEELANNVTRLVGSPFSRLRIGNWRVIFDDAGNVLNIVAIGPRGGIYE
jgi:mRNA interferase RelE/StbE